MGGESRRSRSSNLTQTRVGFYGAGGGGGSWGGGASDAELGVCASTPVCLLACLPACVLFIAPGRHTHHVSCITIGLWHTIRMFVRVFVYIVLYVILYIYNGSEALLHNWLSSRVRRETPRLAFLFSVWKHAMYLKVGMHVESPH